MLRVKSQQPVVGIIADDLTSAADAAAPFVTRGLFAVVDRHRKGNGNYFAQPNVLAVDSASRSMDVASAVDTVKTITAALARSRILFKTVDSTLRGHIRAEVAAAYFASDRKRIVVAPAFPDAGRTTVNGVQFVSGKPVDCSEYSRDPVHPVSTSRIYDLLDPSLTNVTILNAQTQSDLNEQVFRIPDHERVLWVGSPGLAIALSNAVGSQRPITRPATQSSSVLVVVGSANPTSQAQAHRLRQAPNAICLTTPSTLKSDSKSVLDDLIAKASTWLRKGKFKAIIATGGDTMASLLDAMSIGQFVLSGEIEPGFPRGYAVMPNGARITIAMKAGGFGDADTLLHAVAALSKPRPIPFNAL